MQKRALRAFAVFARHELIKQIDRKAQSFGVTPEGFPHLRTGEDYVEIHGVRMSKQYQRAFERWREAYEQKGYEQVIEEAAATWFNRLTAIRYMEVHHYLPERTRLLSSQTKGKRERNEAYCQWLIVQCKELQAIIPFLFVNKEAYTELLLPDHWLHCDSILNVMHEQLEESDFEHVEVIGWLYQYFIAEKKDDVFKRLRKNEKISKGNIPAATQMFTPHWIVRYMVENALGHLWLESHPNALLKEKMTYYVEPAEQEAEVQEELKKLKNPNLSPEEITVLDPACGSGHILVYAFDLLYDMYEERGHQQEDIPYFILENNLYGLDIDDSAAQLASFALLMKGREKTRRVFSHPPQLNIMAIQEANGFDMDRVAAYVGETVAEQEELKELLASFVDAKNYGSILQLKSFDVDKWLARIKEREAQLRADVQDGKPLVDIGREEPCIVDQESKIVKDLFDGQAQKHLPLVKKLVQQAKLFMGRYDVVITNPPYLGQRGMNAGLKAYVRHHYPQAQADLFAVFMQRMTAWTKTYGFTAMINQHSWMFLSTYEHLRKEFLKQGTIYSLLHLGTRAFEDISGEVVQSTCYVQCNGSLPGYRSTFIRLVEASTPADKERTFLNREQLSQERVNRGHVDQASIMEKDMYKGLMYHLNQEKLHSLPGSPVVYWASEQVRKNFLELPQLQTWAPPKQGLATGNNERFLRLWHEVSQEQIAFGCEQAAQVVQRQKRWVPYNKGGLYRKWYGNQKYVVDWYNDGEEIKNFTDATGKLRSRPQNESYYFRQGMTWSFVSSSFFGVRYTPPGFIFDVGGSSLFPEEDDIFYILGFLGSKLAYYYLSYINPTLNFQVGNIASLPIGKEPKWKKQIEVLTEQNIHISKTDWDSFETSWDFKQHPFFVYKKGSSDSHVLNKVENKDVYVTALLGNPGHNEGNDRQSGGKDDQNREAQNLEQSYAIWAKHAQQQFNQLKANEEALNRIFINLHGLQDELTPKVPDEEITVHKADRQREAKSFLSYCVGLIMGRYSLDVQGLVYAGGAFDKSKYTTIQPNEHGIIPVTEEAYFEDDMLNGLKRILVAIYGEEELQNNLHWLAESLRMKKNETPTERLRRYFCAEFYKDHCRTYQKRPIYWLADSGKKKGMRAFIYLHRYRPDTMDTLRFQYVQQLLSKLKQEENDLEQLLLNAADLTATDERAYNKKRIMLRSRQQELLEYDQKLAVIAKQRITLDLDDGVVENHRKLASVLDKMK